MLARIRSAAVLGIDAYPVDVEVDISNGLPSFSTVGLPHGAVKEGRERVSAAFNAVVEASDTLVAEMGERAAGGLLAEANVTMKVQPYARRVVAAARRPG